MLLKLEQAATGFDQDAPLFAWNPPWFLAWFLPLAILGFERAVEDRLPRIQAAVITLLFVAANFLVLRQRSLQAPESEFFWLPLALALLYFWAWRLAYRSR